jgi:hypothetical protein
VRSLVASRVMIRSEIRQPQRNATASPITDKPCPVILTIGKLALLLWRVLLAIQLPESTLFVIKRIAC